MSRRASRHVPIHRRSRSVHHLPSPYQTITETYTKETTTRPVDDYRTGTPDTAIYIPPSNRKRLPEEYPVIRIPSPYSEIYREVYDYETYSKVEHQKSTQPPVVYNVIPPTPERGTGTGTGIPLKKPPLPEYDEYFTSRRLIPTCDENQNPIPRPRSKSPLAPQKAPRGQVRSISSDVDQRYVYTHDVYVDSTTGRPFTPGRESDKTGPRLKINVYFKPEKGVEPRYTLDEIEIAKEDCGTLSRRGTFDKKPQPYPRHSRPQSCNSILRKESEILTVPYEVGPNELVHRETIRKDSELRTTSSNVYRQSTRSSEVNRNEECRSSNRSFEVSRNEPVVQSNRPIGIIDSCKQPTRSSSERTIQIEKLEESSIDMDLIFPKHLPTRPASRNVSISEKSHHSRAHTVPLAVEETLEDPIECKPPLPQKCAPREDYIERSSSYAVDEKFDHQVPIECKPTYQKYPPGEDYHDKSTRYEKTSDNYNPRPTKNHNGPIEEVIHIKEKYEKDETIRRFYPTTTTV